MSRSERFLAEIRCRERIGHRAAWNSNWVDMQNKLQSKFRRISLLERRHCLKYPRLSNIPSWWVLVSFISESAQWGKQQRRAVWVVDVLCAWSDCSAAVDTSSRALNLVSFPWIRVLSSWPEQLSGFHMSFSGQMGLLWTTSSSCVAFIQRN